MTTARGLWVGNDALQRERAREFLALATMALYEKQVGIALVNTLAAVLVMVRLDRNKDTLTLLRQLQGKAA